MGYPDISILAKLADILGVTTNELLNGMRDENSVQKDKKIAENALQYAQKVTMRNNEKMKNIMKIFLCSFSVLAIVVCIICDLAISKGLTWSMYPIISIVFAWFLIAPLFLFENNKMGAMLVFLSAFVMPYLFGIEIISKTVGWMIPLGIPICVASIICLWLLYYLFKKVKNKWYASSIMLLMLLALNMIINAVAARFVRQPFFDVWDMVSVSIIMVIVTILTIIGYIRSQK